MSLIPKPSDPSQIENHSIDGNNALLQHQHPIAVHNCLIIPHCLIIDDAVVTDRKQYPHVEVAVKEKKSKCQPDPGEVLIDTSAHISVYNNAVTISCNLINERWDAYAITVDFPRLYFRHNGRVIDDEQTMLSVLSYFLEVVDELVIPMSKGRALPGIIHNCASYWSKIEFPLQVDDPDGKIFHYLWRAKHSRVNKPEIRVWNETITWKGCEFTLRVYYKAQQLRKKYKHTIDAGDSSILRVEVEYSKKKLRKAFDVPEHCRLTTFHFSDLYKAFHDGVSGLRGAFQSDEVEDVKASKISRFMAQLITDNVITDGVSPNDVLKLYFKTAELAPRQMSKIRSQVYKLISSKSELSLLDLFPQDKQLPSRNISPQREDPITKKNYDVERIPMDLAIDPRVVEAYSSVNFVKYDLTKETPYPSPVSLVSAIPITTAPVSLANKTPTSQTPLINL